MTAKVAQTEPIAEQPARGGSDDDRPRLNQGLKARCKARRVANHTMLPQCTLATEIADHHQAGGDANADRERLFPLRLEACNNGRAVGPLPPGLPRLVFS